MTVAFNASALKKKIVPLPMQALLYRGIRLSTLLSITPPQPLFVSGSPNRFNLKGTRTLYFGENFLTAYAETVQENAGLLIDSPTREQTRAATLEIDDENEEPIVLFAARASLQKVLDLTDEGVRSQLGVSRASLLSPWRWKAYTLKEEALSQQLGEAVFEGGRFEAIRYSSHKAADPHRVDDHAAWAIFVDRLTPPSFVEVSDVSRKLQGKIP